MSQELKGNVISLFQEAYKVRPAVIASAPGRLEILGNHTDYNEGFVLSVATDLYTTFAASISNDDKCSIKSVDIGDFLSFGLNSLSERKSGKWIDYIKGVTKEVNMIKPLEKGFNGLIISKLPMSSGMSSSAALEMSTALSLSKIYNISLDKKEWAKLGQRVENNYLGLKSGLLDQFSSLYGEENKLILCDFRTVEVLKTIPFSSEYVFVVVNSMIKHNLVDSDYNTRRESCERALAGVKKVFSEVKTLRDVTFSMLKTAKDLIDVIDYKRALHVIGENERVMKGVDFLLDGKMVKFGELLWESHESSRNNFENSCSELDYLVSLSHTIDGCIGARLSGGGFGGISIHLVKKEHAEKYKERIAEAFKLQMGIMPQTVICGIGEGAKFLM